MKMLNFFKSNPEKELAKSHIKNLLDMAQVDGHYDSVEKELLSQIAKQYNLSSKAIHEVEKQPNKVAFAIPENKEKKFAQLYDLVNMMLIDGIVHNSEMKLCVSLAERLGYQASKVRELVDSVMQNIKVGNSSKETYNRVGLLINA